ncbi:glycoside hydrolase family 65 protein [Buttiauxella selenatireducens]|uniref:Glycoside hydrolase family 65 protein n=1 Tax=Buttiauxella selenatireducens TaxID=3073902 RepID=A0ABY9SG20_9ENTR|nr:glycoside hydrolase family 65 protein [Buttiauxella sp. R73]WMY76454.1 glycoside hydrolase family 65 protein [Buttiauxella sp. R73]
MSTLTSLKEPQFSPHTLNKFATLMAAGNGYLGLRACHEEAYTDQTRGMYLAGFYHRATPSETTELVNLPDVLQMRIELDGEIFTLLSGSIVDYRRELNYANGELVRRLTWLAPNGKRYQINCQRFLSAAQHSLLCSRIAITPLDDSASVTISTGIDATQTNSGRQHLDEISVRVFEQRYLQGCYRTLDGENEVTIASFCAVSPETSNSFFAKNRRLTQHCSASIAKGKTFQLEKTSWISCSRDEGYGAESVLENLINCVKSGYDNLLAESASVWRNYWQRSRVEVISEHSQDQHALDFALYHLFAMTPAHSERCSIAAKGLTGEGYKGHIFWDTEVFLLPFHLMTQPEIARQLLSYRWHNLAGAQAKAQKNGYQGALFPWESAWSGEEETPEFAAINIRTGLRQKVASALAEHHLVADIAWAVDAYYQATLDETFMRERGVTLLLETARFWISRAVEVNGRLELHDVIGPDEYTEHVNNNAYTNYLAYHNVKLALKYGCFDAELKNLAEDFLTRLWLPASDDNQLIEQDDTFFSKPTIDLAKYKTQQGTQAILLDYSRAEVNEMQILKQADVVMLTYMLPWLFTQQQLAANLDYYEPRTIHDSSLSKAIHGVIAARSGRLAQAYQFWQQACLIDLGDDPHSCDDGIHAAATGAIWLGAVQGFAGLTVERGELHLNPHLPQAWRSISFPFVWQGAQVQLRLTSQQISIITTKPLRIVIEGVETEVLHEFVTPVTGSGTTKGECL